MHNYKQVLVIAAHPDDEMLGCGGTLARLHAEGATITILLLGEGPTARDNNSTSQSATKEESATCAIAASKVLGIAPPSLPICQIIVLTQYPSLKLYRKLRE